MFKNKIKNVKTKKKGFSLVEVLLYIALTSIIIGAIASFTTVTLQFKERTYAISEVEQTGNQLMLLITQTIRNSTAINSPTLGTSAASLSINTPIVGNNPTLFSLSGSTMQMKEGSSSAFNLHGGTISSSALSFTNVGKTGTTGAIRIQFTLTYVNTSNSRAGTYSQTFYNSADIR